MLLFMFLVQKTAVSEDITCMTVRSLSNLSFDYLLNGNNTLRSLFCDLLKHKIKTANADRNLVL